MSERFACIQKGTSIAWALIEFGILFWILATLPSIRDTWLRTAPNRATVLTVQMPSFLGPVHALVPLNCSRFATNDNIAESTQEESGHEEAGGNEKEEQEEVEPQKSQQHKSESARLLSSFMTSRAEDRRNGEGLIIASEKIVRLADPEDRVADRMLEEVDTDESEGVTYNDTYVTVKRCGKELAFLRPSRPQSFWAMTWAGGWDSMQELRATRCRMLWFLTVLCILENFLNLAVAILPRSAFKRIFPEDHPLYQRLAQAEQKEEEQKKAQENEKPGCCGLFCMGCKALCSLPFQLLQKFLSIQGQMAILSLFVLVWHDDYYITSYIPGKAYIVITIFYVSLPFLLLALEFGDSVCTACASFVTCILGSIFLAFVFCMMGFGLYQISFLWNTCIANVVHERSFGLIHSGAQYLEHTESLGVEWKETSDALHSMCIWFFGVHLFDLIVGFSLKLLEVVLLAVGRL